MSFSLSDQVISEFLSGVITVSALIVLGCLLALVLKRLLVKYPFTRLALVLALTPMSLINFMDRAGSATLYLYSTIVILLGITIDGINVLLTPKQLEKSAPAAEEPQEQESSNAQPGVIVWEKAE